MSQDASTIAFRADKRLIAGLNRAAKRNDRTVSAEIRIAVRSHLEAEEEALRERVRELDREAA